MDDINKENNVDDQQDVTDSEDRYARRRSFLIDLLKQILVAVVLFVILINYVMIPCLVDGSSMNPTLKEGDFGYSFIITRTIKIRRFDIAVIQPENYDNRLLVKRVIGLPNETISYIDNRLYVNGEYVEEKFLGQDVYTYDFEITLSDDEYFLMGDNRTVSRDSRYFGPFSKKDILSTHLFVIKPLNDFGIK